jgi:hypothetical protein
VTAAIVSQVALLMLVIIGPKPLSAWPWVSPSCAAVLAAVVEWAWRRWTT